MPWKYLLPRVIGMAFRTPLLECVYKKLDFNILQVYINISVWVTIQQP